MTREELLTKLRDAVPRDRELDHSHAEDWLLEYVNDPEITEAWEKRSSNWWYA